MTEPTPEQDDDAVGVSAAGAVPHLLQPPRRPRPGVNAAGTDPPPPPLAADPALPFVSPPPPIGFGDAAHGVVGAASVSSAPASPPTPTSVSSRSSGSRQRASHPAHGLDVESDGRTSSASELGSVVIAEDVSYGGLGFLRAPERSSGAAADDAGDEPPSPVNLATSNDLSAVLQR